MNADRRKRLADAIALLSKGKDILESVKDEEREAFDNMPESLQQGDRGQTTEQNADALEEAFDAIAEAIGNLEGVE